METVLGSLNQLKRLKKKIFEKRENEKGKNGIGGVGIEVEKSRLVCGRMTVEIQYLLRRRIRSKKRRWNDYVSGKLRIVVVVVNLRVLEIGIRDLENGQMGFQVFDN